MALNDGELEGTVLERREGLTIQSGEEVQVSGEAVPGQSQTTLPEAKDGGQSQVPYLGTPV